MKKIKHPQHILVIDKEFTDELPGMALKHGVTRFNQTQYDYWLERSVAHLMTGQREKMEFDPRFRQILPYTPVIFSDTPENIDWANSPIFLYQRTKQVGEERLGGNFSIGGGGHVDHTDVKAPKSIVNFADTISTNLEREVANEEFEFSWDGEIFTPVDDPQYFTYLPFGLIRDDSNNVGKVHLGVVNVIVVPTAFKVRCKEDELITCTPMSATMLKDANLKYEGWTQILIDAFLDIPCSVAPAPRRTVHEDILIGGTYIETVKGDKWTELAIEFNVTVATLFRLNLGDFDENDISEGTRVNVPDQVGFMDTLYTPDALIDALNNDTEAARKRVDDIIGIDRKAAVQTRMTETVLRGILAQGPDYTNCGLVFLVTQDMYDRLIALDGSIAALEVGGVVSIVEQTKLPGNTDSIAVDPETAKHVLEGSVVWHFEDLPDPAANAGVPGEAVDRGQGIFLELPNPTEADLQDPLFDQIYNVIKNWDVNVPKYYVGYCSANGSHAKLILDSIYAAKTQEGAINVTGDLVPSAKMVSVPHAKIAAEHEVDQGFMDKVYNGNVNRTRTHVLENGDSFISICEKYGISLSDFERWNGFEQGHSWPTPTGYVFIEDPERNPHEEPTL